VLAMPFLVLYKELAFLDSLPGLILVYTLMVLPIVIWVMRDQFMTIPVELVMVASQTGSQGISWWSMAALSTAAIAPLIVVGALLERYIIKGLTAGAVQ
jgi:multiple sugar transport system permease protein